MITGRPARYIRNRLTDDLIASDLDPIAFPAQLSLTAPLGATGDRDYTALFAGQSASLGQDTNARALIESIAEETSRRLCIGQRPKPQS
jgi:nitronate monooxygenase